MFLDWFFGVKPEPSFQYLLEELIEGEWNIEIEGLCGPCFIVVQKQRATVFEYIMDTISSLCDEGFHFAPDIDESIQIRYFNRETKRIVVSISV